MSGNFELNKYSKETKTGMYIDIKQKDDKLLAIMTDVVDGARQPARIGYLDKIGEGENAFMVIKAPLRETNEDGSFKTRARQRDGKFLSAAGKEVESEAEAGQEYVYKTLNGDASKLVYAQVATLNIQNTKKDGTPNAQTQVSVKRFTDAEAREAALIEFKMNKIEDKQDAAYTQLKDELRELRKNQGTYENFFIGKGHESLRAMGFEVRERQREDSPEPS